MHPVTAILLACLLASPLLADERVPVVVTAELNDEPITPATVRYLLRVMDEADRQQAECIVIGLDTPGGLLASTRRLVKRILNSQTPVVIYVAPRGGRAASAGVFITIAGHVAAMAPGTTIGAAHPVQLSPSPITPPGRNRPRPGQENGKEQAGEKSGTSPRQEKIINDTVAWARALAKERGRNEQWVVDAVKQSDSITADEAVEKNVVDLVADNSTKLLEKLDGRKVAVGEESRVLHTASATVERLSMWWGERLLAFIAQPNVAFLLMMLGFYGILFEFYSPGWGVPGTLGAICIVLGLFGLSVLPVNYLGLALIFISLALMAAEVFVTSYGALAVAGAICLVVGGSTLVDSPTEFGRVSLGVVLPVAAATAVIMLLLISGVIRSQRSPVFTGGQALIGQGAQADTTFARDHGHYRGTVRIHGERWTAVSRHPLEQGQPCDVEDRDGLTLTVKAREE